MKKERAEKIVKWYNWTRVILLVTFMILLIYWTSNC